VQLAVVKYVAHAHWATGYLIRLVLLLAQRILTQRLHSLVSLVLLIVSSAPLLPRVHNAHISILFEMGHASIIPQLARSPNITSTHVCQTVWPAPVVALPVIDHYATAALLDITWIMANVLPYAPLRSITLLPIIVMFAIGITQYANCRRPTSPTHAHLVDLSSTYYL